MKTAISSTAAIEKTPVAQDIFTYCTKEKIDTWHVVRNHGADGIVDRVLCKACGSEHKFKRNRVMTSAQRTTALLKRGAPQVVTPMKNSKTLEEDWFASLKKWGSKAVRGYEPKEFFKVGEVLNHNSFGKGVVQGRRENRIDVLFQAGVKTLPSPKIQS